MNHQAIYNTHPTVARVDDSLGAFDSEGNSVAIDQSAVDAEAARLQAELDTTKYQRDRKAEYPSLDELIVALWENVVEERASAVVALEAVRQAVKTKYPK